MRRRALLAAAVLSLAVAVAAAVAWLQVDRLVQWRLERAVPGLTVGRVSVGWGRLDLEGVRLERGGTPVLEVAVATARWRPLSLLSRTVRLDLLELEAPVVRLARDAEGRLGLPLPPGTLSPGAAGGGGSWRVAVKLLQARRGRVELVDAGAPSLQARPGLAGVALTVQGLVLPRGAQRVEVSLEADLDTAAPGRLSARGWYEPGPRRGDAMLDVRGLSLPAVEPWLRSADTTAALESGTLDLRARAVARDGRYAARVQFALEGLRFATEGRFWGAPVQALNDYFERTGRLESDFELEGTVGEAPDLRRALAAAAARALAKEAALDPVESELLDQVRSLVPLPGLLQGLFGP